MKKGKGVFLIVLSLFIVFILTGWAMQAQSQEKYPTRAIDLICPFSPGGTTDLWARITADFLKKKWGVPVNVINKTGGAGVPANVEVYQATPDGYTMLTENQSSCSFLEVSIKDLPFKVMDRTFVALIAVSPSVIICSSKSPWKNLKDLEVEAKKDPSNFTWAALGAGAAEVLQRQFFKAIDVDISKTKPVIVRGMGEGDTLIAGGHIKMGSDAAPTSYSLVKGGMLRALAITQFRMPDLYPDVSTTAEQGYPTVNNAWWWGISGPPKLPPHIIAKWEEILQELLRDPEFVSKIKNSGGIINYQNPLEFRERVRKEMEQAVELWGVK
jgi:tripartite-type tricarboxylate transporter receptor subunit TctC